MKCFSYMIVVYGLLFCSAAKATAGVLVTGEDIIRGRKNLEDTLIPTSADSTSGIAMAVRYVLAREPAPGDSAKAAVGKMLEAAKSSLYEARGFLSDSSSKNLFDALVVFDLIERSNLWDIGEREAIRESMKFILDYYLRPDVMPWDDELWSLGASSMRIATLCALFALNFQNDPDFSRYLEHSRKQLDRNLLNAVDEYGAWIVDSPNHATSALEYLILTAKALKNGNVRDYFSNQRLRSVLMSDIRLLTPRLGSGNRGVFTVDETGQGTASFTGIGISAMAAADVMAHSPSTASQLMWCWEECGRPITPLGLLFIDTSIPSSVPEGGTAIAGNGMTVMRQDFGQAEETGIFADFCGINGIPGYEGESLSYNGDFSFIWRGTPIVVHNTTDRINGSGDCIRFNTAWKHNLVTKRGSGETPVIQEYGIQSLPVIQTTYNNLKKPGDFYPEGINQFLSTVMVDYVCGEVRQSPRDMPPSSSFRHFLFLKPDALLIWDQIQSAFPLEWNIWLAVESVGAEKNILHMMTPYGVDLEAHFTNENTVQYSVDREISTMTWDWPLVMRVESGKGTITVSFLDLITPALENSSTTGLDILSNIVAEGNKKLIVGIIGGTRETAGVLSQRGISCELLSGASLREENLSRYSMLLIDSNPSMTAVRELSDNSPAIDRFVKNGGSVLWICPMIRSWFGSGSRGPGFIPVSMVPGNCPIALHGDSTLFATDVKLSDDSIWNGPRRITRESFVKLLADTIGSPQDSAGATIEIPSTWSESWKILASVRATVPVLSDSFPVFDRPSRIRVFHPAAGAYFTLLLPRRKGKPFLFAIKNRSPGFISFVDDTNTWEIQAGGSSWSDANLSVRISSVDGIKGVYAFDCTNVAVGDERFRSEKPISIYYSPLEGAGVIMTCHDTMVSTSRIDFKLHAGEINFYDFRGDVWTERTTYCTRFTAVDDSGGPVTGIRMFIDGRFVGETDDTGNIVLRWLSEQPEITAKFREFESRYTLVPGEMTITVNVKKP